MTTLFTLLFLSAILAGVGCAWALVCNERTYRHRMLLIGAISEAGHASNFEESYWPALDSASYHRHMWLLATFRDPWAEYVGLPPGFPKRVAR